MNATEKTAADGSTTSTLAVDHRVLWAKAQSKVSREIDQLESLKAADPAVDLGGYEASLRDPKRPMMEFARLLNDLASHAIEAIDRAGIDRPGYGSGYRTDPETGAVVGAEIAFRDPKPEAVAIARQVVDLETRDRAWSLPQPTISDEPADLTARNDRNTPANVQRRIAMRAIRISDQATARAAEPSLCGDGSQHYTAAIEALKVASSAIALSR